MLAFYFAKKISNIEEHLILDIIILSMFAASTYSLALMAYIFFYKNHNVETRILSFVFYEKLLKEVSSSEQIALIKDGDNYPNVKLLQYRVDNNKRNLIYLEVRLIERDGGNLIYPIANMYLENFIVFTKFVFVVRTPDTRPLRYSTRFTFSDNISLSYEKFAINYH